MHNNERFIHQHSTVKLIAKFCVPAMFLVTSTTWAVTYTVIDLATLSQGTTVVVRGPNEAGNAVGVGKIINRTGTVAERRALVFEQGTLRQINGLPGTDYTTAFGLNDVGAVVGSSNAATAMRAFVNTPAGGTRELQPLPGDTASAAFAINNLGQASGFSSGPRGEHAVIWSSDNTATALPGTSSIVMRAFGLNERRDVVGVVDYGRGRRAVLWPGAGAIQELVMLPGHTTSEAMGINASGAVVGYSAASANARRAAMWSSSGGITDLGTLPGGDFSQAFGINDSGDIVGTSTSNSGSRAFLWTSTAGLQDLNGLIIPSPFILTKAVGINNRGMIVALGHDLSPEAHDGHGDHELPVRVFLLKRTGAQP